MLAVGTVVWLASELMFFGGLFAAYFTLKAEARVWPPPGVELETALSAIFTLFLIASSGTMILAVRSTRARRSPRHGELDPGHVRARWAVPRQPDP